MDWMTKTAKKYLFDLNSIDLHTFPFLILVANLDINAHHWPHYNKESNISSSKTRN